MLQGNPRFYSGDPSQIRTADTLLKRQVLCRLSYWIIYQFKIPLTSETPRPVSYIPKLPSKRGVAGMGWDGRI